MEPVHKNRYTQLNTTSRCMAEWRYSFTHS